VRSTLANTPVFTIKPEAAVTISNLQIWKGAEGVENAGHLILDRVWVRGNHGSLAAGGNGTAKLTNVTITGNRGEKAGGFVTWDGGRSTLTNVTIAGNVAVSYENAPDESAAGGI
jgi:hypothetical protein